MVNYGSIFFNLNKTYKASGEKRLTKIKILNLSI